jgi:Tfp pilus assembly protein PilX
MPRPAPPAQSSETGAITILVALMLLVLLTLAAVGMSRNSFREVVNSAFGRQGAMASSLADSGLEWSVYWITGSNGTGASGDALNLVTLETTLAANSSLAGVSRSVTDPTGATTYTPGGALTSGMTSPTTADPTSVAQGYTLGLTYMGQVTPPNTSHTSVPSNDSTSDNLYAIRSDAQVQQNNVIFTHAKEAWVAVPVQ